MVDKLSVQKQFDILVERDPGKAIAFVLSHPGKISKDGVGRIIEKLASRKDNLLTQTMKTNHAFREACDKLGVDYSAKHVKGEGKDGNKFDMLLAKDDLKTAIDLIVKGKVGKEEAQKLVDLFAKRGVLPQTISTNHALREACEKLGVDCSSKTTDFDTLLAKDDLRTAIDLIVQGKASKADAEKLVDLFDKRGQLGNVVLTNAALREGCERLGIKFSK